MKNPHIHLLLQRSTGIGLSAETVDKAVRKRMKHHGTEDLRAYTAEAMTSRDELGALIDLVVVPETWFFRDADAFAAAGAFAAERLVAGRERLRILSLPCASGEEPYSLAIALSETGIAADRFMIAGVDVSPMAIRKAMRAVYQENSFRGCDAKFRARYFTHRADGHALHAEIRQCVYFHCANLLTLDPPPPDQAFDIVFCRNLLIYFDEQTQASAIRRLDRFLRDDGLLFSGYAETAAYCRHGFALAPYAKAFALRKTKHAAPSPRLDALSRPRQVPAVAAPPMPAPKLRPDAVRQEHPEPAALLEKARRLADQGTAAEARAAYRTYLQQVPDSVEAYFMLGLVSEQLQDDREAEKCLRRAVYLDPNHYEALCHLALLAERHGDGATARGFRQRAARVYRRRPEERTR